MRCEVDGTVVEQPAKRQKAHIQNLVTSAIMSIPGTYIYWNGLYISARSGTWYGYIAMGNRGHFYRRPHLYEPPALGMAHAVSNHLLLMGVPQLLHSTCMYSYCSQNTEAKTLQPQSFDTCHHKKKKKRNSPETKVLPKRSVWCMTHDRPSCGR